jgi:hypothetical protein
MTTPQTYEEGLADGEDSERLRVLACIRQVIYEMEHEQVSSAECWLGRLRDMIESDYSPHEGFWQ